MIWTKKSKKGKKSRFFIWIFVLIFTVFSRWFDFVKNKE